MKKCDWCGETFEEEEDTLTLVEGEYICEDCFTENFFICEYCGEVCEKKDQPNTEEFVCDKCKDE